MSNLTKLNKLIDECYVDFVVPAKISFLDFKEKQKAYLHDALRNYCLDNMILLSREQRDYCLKGLAKKVKEAHKTEAKVLKEAEKTKLKEYKMLISFSAYNEEDMHEQLDSLDNYELEWWCCCGE